MKPWVKLGVRVGGSAAVLAGLFALLPSGELATAFARVPPAVWLAAGAAYLSLHFLGAVKWRLTVNLSGAGLSLPQAARCYYAGLFANLFLPSIVGGDVVRAGVGLTQTRSKTGLVVGSLLDRLIDMTALLLVAGLGVLLLGGDIDPASQRVLLTVGAGLAAAGLGAVGVWAMVPARRFPFKVRRRLARLRVALRPARRRPLVVLLSLALGIAVQGTLAVLNAGLGQLCGLECPLAVWLFVWPLAKLSAALPVSLGGLGVREAALAALFQPFGVTTSAAVAAGLAFEVVVFGGGLIGGPIALFLGRVPAPRPPVPGLALTRTR